jgi:TRAP-type C4-dicarboxylate transport system permease small subunit
MSWIKYLLSFRWANLASELAGYLSAAALLIATFSMLHGVVSRYFLGRPTVWQTELSIYLLMFVTFVGAAYGLRHHAHVGVDLVVNRLSPRAQLVSRIFTSLAALVVVLVVAWTSTSLWWEAYLGGWTSSTAWRAPLWIVYFILPFGMFLVAAQYVAFVIEGFAGLIRKASDEEINRFGIMPGENPELAEATGAIGDPLDDAHTAPRTSAAGPHEETNR